MRLWGRVQGDGRDPSAAAGVADEILAGGAVVVPGHAAISARRPVRAATDPLGSGPAPLRTSPMATRLALRPVRLLADPRGSGRGPLRGLVTQPSASPVLAVGSTVIDLTPAPLKELAIETFESDGLGSDRSTSPQQRQDRAGRLGAGRGARARRGRRSADPPQLPSGASIVLGLVAVAAVLAMLRPGAEVVDLVPRGHRRRRTPPWWLDRSARGVPLLAAPAVSRSPEDASASSTEASAAEEKDRSRLVIDPDDEDGPEPSPARSGRRGVLIGTGALSVAAAALGAAGRASAATAPGSRTSRCPPPPTRPRRFPAGLEPSTPASPPFRISTATTSTASTPASTSPIVDVDGWTLTIDGDVDKELELHLRRPARRWTLIERDITLTCVSNGVGGEYVGGARWLGVPPDRPARAGRRRSTAPTRSSAPTSTA